MNYNNEPDIYKKGSIVFRDVSPPRLMGISISLQSSQYELVDATTSSPALNEEALTAPEMALSKTQAEKERKARQKAKIVVQHVDFIKDDFWEQRPWILSNRPGKIKREP